MDALLMWQGIHGILWTNETGTDQKEGEPDAHL